MSQLSDCCCDRCEQRFTAMVHYAATVGHRDRDVAYWKSCVYEVEEMLRERLADAVDMVEQYPVLADEFDGMARAYRLTLASLHIHTNGAYGEPLPKAGEQS